MISVNTNNRGNVYTGTDLSLCSSDGFVEGLNGLIKNIEVIFLSPVEKNRKFSKDVNLSLKRELYPMSF